MAIWMLCTQKYVFKKVICYRCIYCGGGGVGGGGGGGNVLVMYWGGGGGGCGRDNWEWVKV